MRHGYSLPAMLAFAFVSIARGFAGESVIEKPSYFQTLVNPECSHCVDESVRRASELRDDDRVLAWIRGKYDGGAVPYRFFLVPYRVISDTYGVWVYDADAGYVRGYEPSLDFSFYGWRNGVMVIRHKDGTLFSALSGIAFAGPRKGESLKPLPSLETDWGYWLKAYPKTVAYHMFDKYTPHAPPIAVDVDSVSTRPPADNRLPSDEPVIGIAIGNASKVYPISVLAEKRVIRDMVGGQSVVVLWYAPTRTAAIFAPRMEKEGLPERLKLESNPQITNAPFMDKETFSHWTIEGRAVEGPLKGKTLAWLPGVQCKWFAWAAEYPMSDIYSAGDVKAEPEAPFVAKLIEGERLNWDALVKTAACLTEINPNGRSITLITGNDQKSHRLAVTAQTEFHVGGAWGGIADFKPQQSVYLIATANEKKEITGVHALVDDVSYQAMSRPYVLKEYYPQTGRLLFGDEKGRRPVLEVKSTSATSFPHGSASFVKAGDVLYVNMSGTVSDRVATELLDAATFESRRHERWTRHRDELIKNGLAGDIVEVDAGAKRIGVMIRRPDAWYARSLRTGDSVQFKIGSGSLVNASVLDLHPDYSRVRMHLSYSGDAAPAMNAGDEVAVLARIPDGFDFEMPPDLGRFSDRQERIDYFLSTIYCPCGMLGTSCAGHWNTLAACKLHGCGMPNVISKLVGERIDAGRTDEAILGEIVEHNGANVLRIHQN